MKSHDDAAWATPAFDVQGHRGARGLLPENTIPAFRRALELGVTTLEMDAVITKDHQVVLSHEPWFSGVICSAPDGTPVPSEAQEAYRIYALDYAEVARYDCGMRPHPAFPRQERMKVAKPLLRDVIAMAEAYTTEHGMPPIQYNIETKSRVGWDGVMHPAPDVFTGLLYDVVSAAAVKDRTILQSFDARTLRVGRALDPSWRLALLVERAGDPGLEAHLSALGFTPHIYSPDYRLVDEALLRAAHTRGMQVIPWTINDVAEMHRLRALGVDGIITDYPDLGVALLR